MKKIIVVVLFIILVITFFALRSSVKPPEFTPDGIPTDERTVASGTYQIAPGTQITWQGNKPLKQNYQDTGTLSISSGSVTLDEASGTGTMIFDMASITAQSTGSGAGAERLSGHLQSADFFDAEQYPTATLVINDVVPTGSLNEYAIRGPLTIKGNSVEVDFPVIMYTEENTLFVKGSLFLDRTLWDIRYGSGKFFGDLGDNLIDDTFLVTIDITALQ